MKKGWTTTKLIAIGALSALFIVLNLPGAVAASITGLPIFSGIINIIVIGIAYPLVALIIRKPGSVTLWTLVNAIIALPLPIAAPPGFIAKVPYLVSWGLIADVTYLIFEKSDKKVAIMISIVQVGLGGPIAVFLWTLLGAPELASQVSKFTSLVSIIIASILGGVLGLLAFKIYTEIKNTGVIKRIQGNL